MRERVDFEGLWRRHAAEVHRFAWALSGSATAADDLTSETFLRCWIASDRVEVSTVRGYLFTIARNLYLKDRTRASRAPRLDPETVEVADRSADPERWTEARRELARIVRAANRLPECDRAALAMRTFDGLPYDEIARVLGISAGSARIKVHRARLALASADREPSAPPRNSTEKSR